MKNFLIWLISLLVIGCGNEKSGRDYQQAYLKEKNFVADITIDDELAELLPAINRLVSNRTARYFVTEDSFNIKDTNQILLIPFRKKDKIGTASGFSDLANRVVFICPVQIKNFVSSNSLSDTAHITGYLGIILVHEIGHFITGTPGNFDEESTTQPTSDLGQQDMGTEPEYLTRAKQLELRVDSIAIEMVKAGAKSKDVGSFTCCLDIQLAIGGAEFMIFGKRLIEDFGAADSKMLKDKSWSHPNLELRLAFMNYYLNPNEEKRAQIDDYLYEREIAPVNRQLTDPRIYQGSEKQDLQ